MEMNRLLLTLALHAGRYRFLKATGRPGRVEALSMEITRHCVARCVMCNIWRMRPTSPELQAGDWLELLEDPILSELKELDITGGEPFLRSDLVDLLLGVGRLKATHLRRLCSVAVTTNGLLTDKVLNDVGRVIAPLEKAGVALVFACGCDAVSPTHDRIRNFPGAWQRLKATLEGLQALRTRYPSLILGIKTTVTRFNIDELDAICRYADAHGLFTIVSPFIITTNRYDNVGRREDLGFSVEELQKLRDFYRTSRFRWNYYRDELLRLFDSGRMTKPCSAGFNYYFVRSTGELYACPIIDHLLGNVRDTTLATLFRSTAASSFRRKVLKFAECRDCTEPGLERYALPFEGFHYLLQYLKLGRAGFRALHRYLGLDKYFKKPLP
jgi:MoaA/NifB/PqqE/SkfB family radical SAM enzyme